jgi:glycosyltransferase involved in cell wall biosynthesis
MYDQYVAAGLKTELLGLDARNVPGLFAHLNRIVRRHRVSAIVVHHGSPVKLLAACGIKRLRPGLRLLIYLHSDYRTYLGGFRFKRPLMRLVAATCDGFVAISEFVRRSAEEGMGLPGGRVSVVYNGIRLEDYAADRTTRPDGRPVRLFYAGRLVPDKGVSVLLEALSRLESGLPWTLWIAGDGPEKPELEALAGSLELLERVQFLGIRQDIPDILRQADVFVHPALLEEGLGIAVVEAMAAGLIVIATNRGALPELVDSGVNGYLVPAGDAAALAERITAVVLGVQTDGMGAMRLAAMEKSRGFGISDTVRALERLEGAPSRLSSQNGRTP